MSDAHVPPQVASLFELVDDFGIRSKHMRALNLELNSSFSEEHFGCVQFAAISDLALRAVVSDEIVQTATALLENLTAAALHLERLNDLAGRDGLAYPADDAMDEHVRTQFHVRMAIVGLVSSLWGSLDCLAACAIGVLRVPMSLQKGSEFGALRGQLPALLRDGAKSRSQSQLEAWREFIAIVDRHEAMPPTAWLKWLLAMRNASVHRPELARIWVQRTVDKGDPQIHVAAEDAAELARTRTRFDLFLRRRPDIPDTQSYLEHNLADVILNEPASVTLFGMVQAVNELLEDAAEMLLRWWRVASAQPLDFPLPAKAWRPQPSRAGDFAGVAPRADDWASYDALQVEPFMAVRIAVAAKVRQNG